MQTAFLFLFLLFSSCVLAQPVRPYVTNYTPKEYGYQYSGYTHSVCTDSSGFLYAGTAYGILQFNGYTWSFIPVKTGTYIYSLSFKDGRIYAGCNGDFGYLEPDLQGKLHYVSLLEKLPADAPAFSAIWKIIPCGQKIFFQSEEAVFVYDGNKVQVVRPGTSFHLAFGDGKEVYIREREKGLMKWEDEKFTFVNGSQALADTGVFGVLPWEKNERLIITQEAGFFLWTDSSFTRVLPPASKKVFSDAMLLGALLLPDKHIAVYTIKNGIYILNKDFAIVARYSNATGMRSSEVHDLATDAYGNLWAATQKGVCRIQYNSPYSFFGETAGIAGNVQSLALFNGKCFAGTTEGLYSAGISEPAFAETGKVKGGIWALTSAGNSLWAAGDNGLWATRDGGLFTQISSSPWSALLYVPSQNWLIAAGETGMTIYNPQTLTLLKHIPEAASDAYGAACRILPSGIEIWLGSKTRGVCQITTNASLIYRVEYYYGSNDGLTEDWICAYPVADSVLFATSVGFLRFVSPTEINALSGASQPSGAEIRGYFDISPFPAGGNGKSVTCFSYHPTASFIALDNYACRIDMNNQTADNSWFLTMNMGRNNCMYTDGNTLWIGADEGLVVYQTSAAGRSSGFSAVVSGFTIGSDSVLWAGQSPYSGTMPVIGYPLNTIRIHLASLYNDNGHGTKYSWMLEGAGDRYSEWTESNELTFNNLSEGEYILHVKAMNHSKAVPLEIHVPFRILPPWHRTWWAYVIYAIVAAALVFLLIYLNSRRLVAQNRKLEEIIRIRTSEIREQKEEIEKQKETIEEILKDLNDSISYAQRIQQAILPSHEIMENCFSEHFILYRPRNVVSGDFYWGTRVNEWIVITAADCTGHGVPGAFMSMLGMSFLNEIVRKKEIINAAEILNQLRAYVIEALKQSGYQSSQKDGMDMSLCAINTQTGKCYWAGANNPLWYIRKEDIGKEAEDRADIVQEIKADKMPVAIHIKMDSFTKHELQLNKGDIIYMFSDGYADQFGGPKGKKFLYKSFKRLLGENASLPMKEQGEKLNAAFESWLCDHNENYEQIDDVTVLGIKF
jgi:serine phosphatase RsbU (regulator of sigma subunit)